LRMAPSGFRPIYENAGYVLYRIADGG